MVRAATLRNLINAGVPGPPLGHRVATRLDNQGVDRQIYNANRPQAVISTANSPVTPALCEREQMKEEGGE